MPTKFHDYAVRGPRSTGFPLDMLRHDGAWPADGDAVTRIGALVRGEVEGETKTVTVRLRGAMPPNRDRWASFGWHVIG